MKTRGIVFLLDNSLTMTKYASLLRESISSIIGFARKDPYVLEVDIDIMFVSYMGEELYKTSIITYTDGNISLNLSSESTINCGVRTLTGFTKRLDNPPFVVIIDSGTNSEIANETIALFNTYQTDFVVIALNKLMKYDWVARLTDNPRIFYAPLNSGDLNQIFAVPSVCIGETAQNYYGYV